VLIGAMRSSQYVGDQSSHGASEKRNGSVGFPLLKVAGVPPRSPTSFPLPTEPLPLFMNRSFVSNISNEHANRRPLA
jgi:hypothetical protein